MILARTIYSPYTTRYCVQPCSGLVAHHIFLFVVRQLIFRLICSYPSCHNVLFVLSSGYLAIHSFNLLLGIYFSHTHTLARTQCIILHALPPYARVRAICSLAPKTPAIFTRVLLTSHCTTYYFTRQKAKEREKERETIFHSCLPILFHSLRCIISIPLLLLLLLLMCGLLLESSCRVASSFVLFRMLIFCTNYLYFILVVYQVFCMFGGCTVPPC